MRPPAILGGHPAFDAPLRVAHPPEPPWSSVGPRMRSALASGDITNALNVKRLEDRLASLTGASCACVSSATSGLMLLLRVMRLQGYVLMPSFTFPASAHAASWNGLRIRFADIDPETLCLSPGDLQERVDRGCGCIMAVHTFGGACDVHGLEAVAADHEVPLIFDSAHAFGTMIHSRYLGTHGSAEVFSFSPSKVLTSCEGGAVCTVDPGIATAVRTARDYGGSLKGGPEIIGLNARMSELHAVIGDALLDHLEGSIAHRERLAKRYRDGLADLPGISFQSFISGCRPNRQSFPVLVDEAMFGLDRDRLAHALALENIETRKYFVPLHTRGPYRDPETRLPVTEEVARQVLILPMHSRMSVEDASSVCSAIRNIHEHLKEVRPRGGTL